MLNHKTIFKQKSKILLIILSIFGLAFSYSCSCRNPNKPPTGSGTFAPRLDLGNSYNVAFTSEGKEQLHASVKFIEPNKYGYKAEITEVKDGQGELTKENIQYNDDGTFTISEATLKALANKLTPENNMPATNEVSITFKLTSTDTSLNNNTTNITQTLYFIKAFKFDNSNIEALIQSAYHDTIGDFVHPTTYHKARFNFFEGNYNSTQQTFTLKESINELEPGEDIISKSALQAEIKAHLQNGDKTKNYFTSVSLADAKELDGGNAIGFDTTLNFVEGFYETDIKMPIIIKVVKSKGGWAI